MFPSWTGHAQNRYGNQPITMDERRLNGLDRFFLFIVSDIQSGRQALAWQGWGYVQSDQAPVFFIERLKFS